MLDFSTVLSGLSAEEVDRIKSVLQAGLLLVIDYEFTLAHKISFLQFIAD